MCIRDRVYFVGAGSGAADLITVRGMHMLQQADVIIYAGSLVNPELLEYARADCEIHNSAHLTLEEVLKMCIRDRYCWNVCQISPLTKCFPGNSLWIVRR